MDPIAQLLAAYVRLGNYMLPLVRSRPELARLPITHIGPCSVTLATGPHERIAFFGIRRRETAAQKILRHLWRLNPLATTLTLQPDYQSSTDTFILNSMPDMNKDANGELRVGDGSGGGYVYRSLIKFDLTGLPSAATISSAVLSLYCTEDDATSSMTVRVYRQKRAWVAAEATWNIYKTGSSWGTAGGFGADDCEQTDIGSLVLSASETVNQWKDWSLTPTTKSALDLGNGWLLKDDAESGSYYIFKSSVNVSEQPKLVIEYTEGATGPHKGSRALLGVGV